MKIFVSILIVCLLFGCRKKPTQEPAEKYQVITYSNYEIEYEDEHCVPGKWNIVRMGLIIDAISLESFLPDLNWPSEVTVIKVNDGSLIECEFKIHKIEYIKPKWAKQGSYICWLKIRINETGQFACYVIDDRTIPIFKTFECHHKILKN